MIVHKINRKRKRSLNFIVVLLIVTFLSFFSYANREVLPSSVVVAVTSFEDQYKDNCQLAIDTYGYGDFDLFDDFRKLVCNLTVTL